MCVCVCVPEWMDYDGGEKINSVEYADKAKGSDRVR